MTTKYKCLYEITGRIEDVATFLVPISELPKEPEQEPVAYKCWHPNGYGFYYGGEPANQFRADTGEPNEYFGGKTEPLYTTPPQRKPLTDEQIVPMFRAREKLKALGEKDAWFWYAWGIGDSEAVHGIKESL